MDSEKKQELIKIAKANYIKERPIYKKLAVKVENIIEEVLDNDELSYHIILCRAKTIDSYVDKCSSDKYDDPVNQIFDMAGIRVITYVESEVEKVCEVIENTFKINKSESSDKSSELGVDKVGYKSIHDVCQLKSDRLNLPEYKPFKDKYFEIQVRTILQHAWAEITHDRNYKFSGVLPDDIQRRFMLISGQLEMADREFNLISLDIDKIKKEVEKGTKEGKLDIKLNSTTLNQYYKTKLPVLYKKGTDIDTLTEESKVSLIQEMSDFGISTLAELDKIIPSDFEKKIIEFEPDYKYNVFGLFRMLLIITDFKKYFKNSWNKKWQLWSDEGKYKEVYNYYKIDWADIKEKYGINFEPDKK